MVIIGTVSCETKLHLINHFLCFKFRFLTKFKNLPVTNPYYGEKKIQNLSLIVSESRSEKKKSFSKIILKIVIKNQLIWRRFRDDFKKIYSMHVVNTFQFENSLPIIKILKKT